VGTDCRAANQGRVQRSRQRRRSAAAKILARGCPGCGHRRHNPRDNRRQCGMRIAPPHGATARTGHDPAAETAACTSIVRRTGRVREKETPMRLALVMLLLVPLADAASAQPDARRRHHQCLPGDRSCSVLPARKATLPLRPRRPRPIPRPTTVEECGSRCDLLDRMK
jgi:hypothetical protein